MTRELAPFERQTLQQLDALRQRFIDAQKAEDVLFEINNALSLWSTLRGFHIARLGQTNGPPPLPRGETDA